METYKVNIPNAKGSVEASDRRSAIDMAIEHTIMKLKEMQKDGSIYAAPDVCKLAKKSDKDLLLEFRAKKV